MALLFAAIEFGPIVMLIRAWMWVRQAAAEGGDEDLRLTRTFLIVFTFVEVHLYLAFAFDSLLGPWHSTLRMSLIVNYIFLMLAASILLAWRRIPGRRYLLATSVSLVVAWFFVGMVNSAV